MGQTPPKPPENGPKRPETCGFASISGPEDGAEQHLVRRPKPRGARGALPEAGQRGDEAPGLQDRLAERLDVLHPGPGDGLQGREAELRAAREPRPGVAEDGRAPQGPREKGLLLAVNLEK